MEPIFFLHVRSAHGLAVDREGEQFADLASAVRSAEAGARELVADMIAGGLPVGGEAIEICDRSGETVASLSFRNVLLGTQPG